MQTIRKPFFLMLITLFALSFGSCKKSVSKEIFHSPFHPRIAAFTSGYISATGSFLVEFSDSVPSAVPGADAPASIASLSPKVSGKWNWVDHRTVRFVPASRLPSGQKWQVTMHLGKIFPGEKDDFHFGVATMEQNYRVILNTLQSASEGDFDNYKLSGKLLVADDITSVEARQIVSVTLNGKVLPVTWQHPDGKNHYFEVAPIERGTAQGNVSISHSGKAIGAKGEGVLTQAIPAKGEFSLLAVESEQQPRQVVRLVFSDPLDRLQNLEGLISLSDVSRFSYVLNDNVVEVFPALPVYGDFEVVVMPGIQNARGARIAEVLRHQIAFASLNPAVEFIGQGNILPFSDNLMMHFKAVGLKKIMVRIIKIYENNVPHFLQINTLDESSQLKRAGRLVHQSMLALDEDPTLDLNRWNSFALELSRFIQPDPGAIYRIELAFDRSCSVYPCAEGSENETSGMTLERMANDQDFWDRPDDYYSEYPYYYEPWDWYQRDNPCSDAYYRRSRWVSRNVMASNLGIILKSGTTGQLKVFVTDLRSTEPVSDVTLEVLNFQMQPLVSGKTASDGSASFQVDGRPFLLVAKKDKQRGYLRLDDGRSLSLSRFDVAGQTLRDGLKGYIYGERGVWRPGDSIFISFIPEDRQNRLPANHPAVFELINPRGQLVARQVARHPNNRLYTFRTATQESAPTGFWLARVSLGDAVFEQNIRIETIKPNRLRIELGFDGETLSAQKPVSVKLFAEWLHGATASNLKSRVTVGLQTMRTSFTNFQGFSFDDATRQFEPSESIVFDGTLDATGKAVFKALPSMEQRAPGFLQAAFTTRVFEEGGSFSIDRVAVPFSPYGRYVGIRAPKGDQNGMLLTDDTHQIEVATVSETGEPLSVNNLSFQIYKLNWRWWWDRSEEDLARYVSSGSATLIQSGRLNTTSGKAMLPFRIDRPEWGRYLIRVVDEAGGHSASQTVLVDWPGWAQKPGGIDADAASVLTFNTDKPQYSVGEKATVTFPSGDKGRALISVENGSGVLRTWWVSSSKGSTSFSFDVTEEMTPNIYLHISLLQPHGSKDNDLPVRMYGVIPVMVHSPATVLSPVINTAAEWRPGQRVSVEVTEKSGLEMSYTLAVVDDGLLGLTRFRTPNAWNHFNAREALGVKTWDIYDYVLGAYGGRIERLFSIGGDDELLGAGTDNQVRRFEPMVRYLGPFELKRRGKNRHQIDVPNYFGSVRVMVVATSGKAQGAAEKGVTVRQPLMVWSALPRVLGPAERVSLPVTVFASGSALGEVKVKVNTGKGLTVNGNREKVVRFDKDGEKTIFFELTAGEFVGTASVEVTAENGSEKGSHTVNLPIRSASSPVTRVVSAVIPAGAKSELSYKLNGMIGTNSAVMELSTIQPIDFGRRLKYLLDYPHGCIEQITSGAFPQLYLPDVSMLQPAEISKTQENVRSVIGRLAAYQTPNGGFAYWPGGAQPDAWSTSYAGHFMLEAEKKGYTVPRNLRNAWINHQKAASSAWAPDRSGRNKGSDLIQAYRLYTLVLAGETDMAGMNRLRQQTGISGEARWRLAAAYALAGIGEVARELTTGAPEQFTEYDWNGTYGSPDRDMAMMLETLILLNDSERAARLAQQLSIRMRGADWMSTQTTAYALMALSHYAAGRAVTSNNARVQIVVNSQTPEQVTFQKAMWQKPLLLENLPEGKITVENKSEGEVFANLILTGQPMLDTAHISQTGSLGMQIRYFDLDNKPIDVSKLKQGADFKVVVTLNNSSAVPMHNLALSQVFPSGWEVRNLRFEESGQAHELDQPDYRDIRDDRVYSYFTLRAGERKRLVTVLHASYAGRFFLPPVSCEAMYDYSVRASEAGGWVEVER